jgi:hypothetical protein
MTLLELMLATTILALLLSVSGGWALRQARLAKLLDLQAERLQVAMMIQDLLREDLLQAQGPSFAASGEIPELVVNTIHRAPGDLGAPLALVVWRHDSAAHRLVRRRGDGPVRTLLEGVRSIRFNLTDRITALHLDFVDGSPLNLRVDLARP